MLFIKVIPLCNTCGRDDDDQEKNERWSDGQVDDEASINPQNNVLKQSNLKAVLTNLKHKNLAGQPTFEKVNCFLVQ